MLLAQLLHSVEYHLLQGSTAIEITGITDCSMNVKPGDMFVCVKGYHTDGHRYLPEVLAAGTVCIVVEQVCEELKTLMEQYGEICVILVKNTMKALALLASAYYGEPSHRLTMIGITGTKGKTTTACMLNGSLRRAGIASGMIGTLGAWYDETLETPVTTTPDAITLHRLLARMEKMGCTHVILEVSSQSLMKRRVYGIPFRIGIYTNLYPDHIGPGEHGSLEEYCYWKSTLFTHSDISVINQNARGAGMMADMAASEVVYYLPEEISQNGVIFDGHQIDLSLPGRYNQENALAAMTAAKVLGVTDSAYQVLETISVPGRSELLQGEGYQVVIDYAHNESSMENLLTTLREMNPKRLVCVYGSGGNRSVLRRKGMGRAGGRLADLSVLTEDNSRTEPLKQIIDGLIEGVTSEGGEYMVIPDRREAIHHTIHNAREGDLIAIIGKGHENYQEIGTERFPFSDREEARLAMSERGQR